MGLFSVFKRKKAPTSAVVHQTWMGIGQYEYAPVISDGKLSLILRWKDYGTGGRLGYCKTKKIIADDLRILRDKEVFCKLVITNIVAMQPYRTITDDDIVAHRPQLERWYDEKSGNM